MLRILILLLACILVSSCSDKKLLKVSINIEGSKTVNEEFHSRQKAADWIADSVHGLWLHAEAIGRSANFFVISSGLDLAGEIHAPVYRFQKSEENKIQMVQVDDDGSISPKIEGAKLEWHSVRSYIKEDLFIRCHFNGL